MEPTESPPEVINKYLFNRLIQLGKLEINYDWLCGDMNQLRRENDAIKNYNIHLNKQIKQLQELKETSPCYPPSPESVVINSTTDNNINSTTDNNNNSTTNNNKNGNSTNKNNKNLPLDNNSPTKQLITENEELKKKNKLLMEENDMWKKDYLQAHRECVRLASKVDILSEVNYQLHRNDFAALKQNYIDTQIFIRHLEAKNEKLIKMNEKLKQLLNNKDNYPQQQLPKNNSNQNVCGTAEEDIIYSPTTEEEDNNSNNNSPLDNNSNIHVIEHKQSAGDDNNNNNSPLDNNSNIHVIEHKQSVVDNNKNNNSPSDNNSNINVLKHKQSVGDNNKNNNSPLDFQSNIDSIEHKQCVADEDNSTHPPPLKKGNYSQMKQIPNTKNEKEK